MFLPCVVSGLACCHADVGLNILELGKIIFMKARKLYFYSIEILYFTVDSKFQ